MDQNAVTVELWLADTYNRHIGQLLDVGAAIEPSAAQAALWYFEQRLERAHGIKAESQSFAGAAEKAAEKRGIVLDG